MARETSASNRTILRGSLRNSGSLDASGEGQLGLALGSLGAGVEHARVLLQAVAIELPSGAIRLGAASALTLLDAAF